jgi:hypothetical protein
MDSATRAKPCCARRSDNGAAAPGLPWRRSAAGAAAAHHRSQVTVAWHSPMVAMLQRRIQRSDDQDGKRTGRMQSDLWTGLIKLLAQLSVLMHTCTKGCDTAASCLCVWHKLARGQRHGRTRGVPLWTMFQRAIRRIRLLTLVTSMSKITVSHACH